VPSAFPHSSHRHTERTDPDGRSQARRLSSCAQHGSSGKSLTSGAGQRAKAPRPRRRRGPPPPGRPGRRPQPHRRLLRRPLHPLQYQQCWVRGQRQYLGRRKRPASLERMRLVRRMPSLNTCIMATEMQSTVARHYMEWSRQREPKHTCLGRAVRRLPPLGGGLRLRLMVIRFRLPPSAGSGR
jgi:hypothetical protein